MSIASLDFPRLESRLRRLYGQRCDEALPLVVDAINRVNLSEVDQSSDERWNQRDVVLITYGDQIQSAERNPLQTLLQFLVEWDLPGLFSTVHFLPCFPYTSDDGFSVVDYRTIDPNLGAWEDIDSVSDVSTLMLDFVVNHVSQSSQWFQDYLAGHLPYLKYFIEADPHADLSAVTRPRSLPLLSEFETSRGQRWLWTTFSRDQVDLNYAEPTVLAEVIEILLEYVRHGARIIRLDAIAYLWKQTGTSCIHLPETHEVVKLLRDVMQTVAPHVLLLTETNVPHEENVSYFGDGDEAHVVYQFSFPPLLLDAFLNEDAEPLKNWLANLQSPPPGATYLNFTASHDGIGVRPLEGRISTERLARLVDKIKQRGGLIGTRRQSDGTDSPYELNISYVDALSNLDGDPNSHAARFLASQAVMLALQGVPAVYFHSLVGTQNDLEGVETSGTPRRINRRKFDIGELSARINDNGTLQNAIFSGLRHLLGVRIEQPAFHPDAGQEYVESGAPNLLVFRRSCSRSGQSILVAVNFGDNDEEFDLPAQFVASLDLLGSTINVHNGRLGLAPAQVVWLTKES